LKQAPNGDLLLTSGADGTIIDIQNPGTAHQAVAFTTIQNIPAASIGNAGLDDVIKPSATAGTFYFTDTKTNKVYSVHATGLNTNDYYASVGSLKAFGQIDPTTGVFTPLITAANAGDMNFAAPHGVVFVPDQNAPAMAQVDSIKTFATTPNNVAGLDSITIAGKFVFVEYGNNVDSTGAIPGKSTIIQYDKAGNFVHAYAIEGSVDGLKYNPQTGMVWALQNQDGRSSLSLIDFALVVKRAGRLVKNQNARVRDQSSCDRDALTLAARKRASAFTDHGVVTIRQFQDELVSAGETGGGQDGSFQPTVRSRSKPWSTTRTSVSCIPVRAPRSRSIPSISPAMVCCTATWSVCLRTRYHATPANQTRRDRVPWTVPRPSRPTRLAYRSIKRRWRSTTSCSISRQAWPLPSRSKPARGGLSIICSRLSCATIRRACASDDCDLELVR
jgi:hypothetical protein